MRLLVLFLFLFFRIELNAQNRIANSDTACLAKSLGNRYKYEFSDSVFRDVDSVLKFKNGSGIRLISAVDSDLPFKNYRSNLKRDSSILKWSDTAFYLPIDNGTTVYGRADKRDYSGFDYYRGLLEKLNLYAVSSIAAIVEIGSLKMIDKHTGKIFYIESPYDYPMDSVDHSPGNKFLSSYVIDLYSDNSFISVLKLNNTGDGFCLNEYFYLDLSKMKIENLWWISETVFLLKIFDSPMDHPMIPFYLKIDLSEV